MKETPRFYERPVLNIKKDRPLIKIPEPLKPLRIWYKFKNSLTLGLDENPNDIKYDLILVNNPTYVSSPDSIRFVNDSYTYNNIDFKIKTLSFWFNVDNFNIDNYLLSIGDAFYIKQNNNNLFIQTNTDVNSTIITDYISNEWNHLILNYNNLDEYDIYINSNLLPDKVIYTDISLLDDKTLYLGQHQNFYNNYEIINTSDPVYLKFHGMVAINTELYMFGGRNSSEINDNKLYKNNFTQMVEIPLENNDGSTTELPKISSFPMITTNNKIYIYGGYIKLTDDYSTDFISIDINTNKFVIGQLVDDLPAKTDGHAMAARADTSPFQIFIFGGIDDQNILYNDLYRVASESMLLTKKLTILGDIPDERFDHDMVADNKYLYIFGGRTRYTFFNDFYRIDIIDNFTDEHNSEKVVFNAITPRRSHKMEIIEDNIFIVGGITDDDVILNDIHIINKTTLQITHSFNTLLPENIVHYALCSNNNDILIHGGATLNLNEYGVFQSFTNKNKLYKIKNITNNLNGNISDFQMYYKQLSQLEIFDLYNSNIDLYNI
tara:strand:+ start:418 stop:2064 length:1647 start_codon:yes stop_codon:yes gene_type:complete